MAIARPPRTHEGRTTSGNPIFSAAARAFLEGGGDAARRLRDAEIPQELREPLAILRQVDRIRRRAEDLHARFLQRERQLERRLAAVLTTTETSPPASRSRSMIANTSSKVSGSK